MMNKMIVGNLVHRPLRSLISIVAIALEVTLILLIVGLCVGMLNDSKARQAGIGADVVVMPPGSAYIVGLTGAPMPIKIRDVLAKLPHVVAVAPVVTNVSAKGTIEVINGIDLKSYESLGGPFRYIHGGPFQGPDDALIDDILARSKKIKVGDTIDILDHKFRVSGIVEPGRGARKFVAIERMQDLIGAYGKASIFYLKLDDPANADAVVDEIKRVPGMETYVASSMAYYLSMMTVNHLPLQALHCERDSAGNDEFGNRRYRGGNPDQSGRTRCHRQPLHSARGHYRRLAAGDDGDRNDRSDPGCFVPGVAGGAKGSD